MSMARVWQERGKSEANKCKMYDGTYGSQLMVNGSWTNQAVRITGRFFDPLKMADVIIMNEIKTL